MALTDIEKSIVKQVYEQGGDEYDAQDVLKQYRQKYGTQNVTKQEKKETKQVEITPRDENIYEEPINTVTSQTGELKDNTPIQKNEGLLDRIGKDLNTSAGEFAAGFTAIPKAVINTVKDIPNIATERGANIINDKSQEKRGDITQGTSLLNQFSQGVAAIGDVGGSLFTNILKSFPETVKKPVNENTQKVIEGILNKSIGTKVIPETGLQTKKTVADLLSEGLDKYNNWAKANPNEAKNLESVINIGQVIPLIKTGKLALTAPIKAGEEILSKVPGGKVIKDTVNTLKEKIPNVTLTKSTADKIKEKAINMSNQILKPGKYEEDAAQAFAKYVKPSSSPEDILKGLQETKKVLGSQFDKLKGAKDSINDKRISSLISFMYDTIIDNKNLKKLEGGKEIINQITNLYNKRDSLIKGDLQPIKNVFDQLFDVYKNSKDVKSGVVKDALAKERNYLKTFIENSFDDINIKQLNKDYNGINEAIDAFKRQILELKSDRSPDYSVLRNVLSKVPLIREVVDKSSKEKKFFSQLEKMTKNIQNKSNTKSLVELIGNLKKKSTPKEQLKGLPYKGEIKKADIIDLTPRKLPLQPGKGGAFTDQYISETQKKQLGNISNMPKAPTVDQLESIGGAINEILLKIPKGGNDISTSLKNHSELQKIINGIEEFGKTLSKDQKEEMGNIFLKKITAGKNVDLGKQFKGIADNIEKMKQKKNYDKLLDTVLGKLKLK